MKYGVGPLRQYGTARELPDAVRRIVGGVA